MKHWCMKRSTCSCTARTTASGLWPRFWQAIPPAKSRYSFPSASQIVAPSARETVKSVVAIPRGTKRSRPARTASAPWICSVAIATTLLQLDAQANRVPVRREMRFVAAHAGDEIEHQGAFRSPLTDIGRGFRHAAQQRIHRTPHLADAGGSAVPRKLDVVAP